MPPSKQGALSLLLCACLGLLAACTAWQYDVESCDPNLGLAACMRINVAKGIDITPNCAKIYQCNKTTLLCEQSVKDIDQDGDVLPECGGTDCNDNDARYSGIAQTCGCNLVGKPCKAGKGACVVDLTTECRNGNLSCPEQQAPQYRDTAWHKEPFSGGAFTSWDWNCNQSGDSDENTEKNCAYDLAGQALPCSQSACSEELQGLIGGSTNYARDVGAFCNWVCTRTPPYTDFCRPFTSPAFDLNCINRCGSPIIRCQCVVMCPNFNCNTCGLQAASVVGTVSCR